MKASSYYFFAIFNINTPLKGEITFAHMASIFVYETRSQSKFRPNPNFRSDDFSSAFHSIYLGLGLDLGPGIGLFLFLVLAVFLVLYVSLALYYFGSYANLSGFRVPLGALYKRLLKKEGS